MAKFLMTERVTDWENRPARLGSGAAISGGVATGNGMTDADVGKFVKLVAESRYDLCSVGDAIEAWVTAMEVATLDGFSVGTVAEPDGYKEVTFDGLQGTPGTGTIAVGDYVVCGTPVARGTALSAAARVCKATTQANVSGGPFPVRVVSLGTAGTGAPGTTGIVEFLG